MNLISLFKNYKFFNWTKIWKPATLLDYNKYGWYGYEHLKK